VTIICKYFTPAGGSLDQDKLYQIGDSYTYVMGDHTKQHNNYVKTNLVNMYQNITVRVELAFIGAWLLVVH
jgi:hypothetical protein